MSMFDLRRLRKELVGPVRRWDVVDVTEPAPRRLRKVFVQGPVWDVVDVTKLVGPNTIFFDRRHTHPDYDWRDPHKALDWSKVRAPRRL